MRARQRVRAASWWTVAALSVALYVATTAAASMPERGPAWSSLTPVQQQALAPLQRDWISIAAEPKQKWLEVAGRLPQMSTDERTRVRERMAEWSRMTPTERANARVQFQEVRRLSPDDRQARWQEYQQLPDGERSQLSEKARADREAARVAAATVRRAPEALGTAGKSSTVAPVRLPVSPGGTASAQQSKPGATTTTIATRPAPPAHHQAGLPKIVATPGFVDRTTLLPKRGPQGAAVRPASVDPVQQP